MVLTNHAVATPGRTTGRVPPGNLPARIVAPSDRIPLAIAKAVLGTLILVGLTRSLSAASPDPAMMAADQWYLIRFDGEPVGYERVTSRPADADSAFPGTAVIRLRETRLQLKRLGADLSVTASLETSETTDGRLLAFSLTRTDAAGKTIERTGERKEISGAFAIEEKVQATRRRYTRSAPADIWSPVMSVWIGQWAVRNAKRDTRPVLFPETAAVAEIVVEGGRSRRVRLADGTKPELLSVDFYPLTSPQQRTRLGIDSQGLTVLQESSVLGGTLTLELTSAGEALAAASGKSLDLDAAAIIPVDRVLRRPEPGSTQILELRTDGPLRTPVPAGSFQQVQRVDDRTVRITLITPERSRRDARPSLRPGRALEPTSWLPTQDPIVQRLALAGAVGETDPLRLCLRLERFLHSKMRHSAFSTSMLPADEVARSLKGDCTEHAVLLAAVIRVHGIPSRVVSGLVAGSHGYGFVGHLWTEAQIGDVWYPFDSTLPSDRFDVPHIRLADSELPDGLTSGVTLFIPVLDLTGRSEIRVISE